MTVSDLQMQVPPGNSQVSHFGGLSSPFPNKSVSSPVSSYPLHHQPSHPVSPQQPQIRSPHHQHFQGPGNRAPNPQQQAYAIRLAKERQQHRFMQQQLQHPQYAVSSSSMPHLQSQPQLPVSSPGKNSSQVQLPAGSPPVSVSPLTSSMNSMPQHQQKPQTPTQGVVRNAQAGGSGLTNQTSKQRQKQQFSQVNRQHPQQRQQPQAQQPNKVGKGVGRGNLMIHQNIPVDPAVVNGVSTSPGNQLPQKGEAATHLYAGSLLNAVQPTRQHFSPQSSTQSMPHQKLYPGHTASSTKHPHQMTHSDNSSQGSGHQSVSSLAVAGSNLPQALSHQKSVNQNQLSLHRVAQPSRAINPDQSNKRQVRDSEADQHPSSCSTEMDTMVTLPQATSNAAMTVQAVCPANTHQRRASEPLFDPNALNSVTNLSSLVSTASKNASDSAPQVGQGLGQRLSSANIPSIRHDSSAQRHQQPSQLQQPDSPVPQQHQQPLPPLNSQQQAQLLQAGNGKLYGRPADHRLE